MLFGNNILKKKKKKIRADVRCPDFFFFFRPEQAATLYQNISLTEPRLIPQFEKVIINFTKEIKQQNSEMENLALAIKR